VNIVYTVRSDSPQAPLAQLLHLPLAVEELPAFGPIQVSLTTRGVTSPKSALAVDRFPVAANVAKNLGKKVIVQHGVDLNDNGRYDFKAAGKSELDPSLPQEATLPATCGVISPKRQHPFIALGKALSSSSEGVG
jgi:hypothetical protein